MEAKILSKESFPIIGVALRTTTDKGKNFIEIPQFWEKVLAEGKIDRIPDRKDPESVLGVCTDFEPDGRFSYIIGSEVTRTDNAPEGMESRIIPAAQYAVFTARGQMPSALQDTVRYVYQTWLPASEFQRANAADFELYDNRFSDEDDAEVDIYVPIVSS